MELLGPDPKAVARQKALDAKRAEEEQFAKDTLAQAGIGSGIVTSQMLVVRRARSRLWATWRRPPRWAVPGPGVA